MKSETNPLVDLADMHQCPKVFVPGSRNAYDIAPADPGYFTKERLLRLLGSVPDAFWRFDVDVSLEAARRMGELVQTAGVKATFCVMLRSQLYNPFSGDGRHVVEELRSRGHRVAPHCLALAHVPQDLALFDLVFPRREPPFVSFHMTGPGVLWRDFPGFDHGHASRWKNHYLSDSRGEPLSRGPSPQDQVALHAEWWMR